MSYKSARCHCKFQKKIRDSFTAWKKGSTERSLLRPSGMHRSLAGGQMNFENDSVVGAIIDTFPMAFFHSSGIGGDSRGPIHTWVIIPAARSSLVHKCAAAHFMRACCFSIIGYFSPGDLL